MVPRAPAVAEHSNALTAVASSLRALSERFAVVIEGRLSNG